MWSCREGAGPRLGLEGRELAAFNSVNIFFLKYPKLGKKTTLRHQASRPGVWWADILVRPENGVLPLRYLGVILTASSWLLLLGCSEEVSGPMPFVDGAEDAGKGDESTGTKGGKNRSPMQSDVENSENSGKLLKSGDAPVVPVTYPEIELSGKGTTLCDGDTYKTTATVRSRLTESLFAMDLETATVYTRVGQDRVQEEIDRNLSAVEYSLVPVAERGKIDGKDFAIFGTGSVQAKKDIRFTFSSPLPVYIWPAPASRFDALRTKGPQSWTATVTGKRTFEATVTLTYLGGFSNTTTIRLETTIPSDRNGELYEDFPIAKSAEITVDGDRQLVVSSKNENHFYGNEHCDKKRGKINIQYQVCRKITGGKVEDLGCP